MMIMIMMIMIYLGGCVFLSMRLIDHFIHIMYHRCIISNLNALVLNDIYIPRVGVAMMMCRIMRYCLSCLVSIMFLNCIVHHSLYYNMNIGTM